MTRSTHITLVLTLALGSLSFAGAAAATPRCHKVVSVVTLAADPEPTCGSPIGLCAGGELRGTLRGSSEFVGTSFTPTVDTAATGTVLLTGDNTIHTARGDIFTKDAIVLATTGDGEFAEVDTIVGGTGDYAGATGQLIGTGTFIDGVGEGLLIGEICR